MRIERVPAHDDEGSIPRLVNAADRFDRCSLTPQPLQALIRAPHGVVDRLRPLAHPQEDRERHSGPGPGAVAREHVARHRPGNDESRRNGCRERRCSFAASCTPEQSADAISTQSKRAFYLIVLQPTRHQRSFSDDPTRPLDEIERNAFRPENEAYVRRAAHQTPADKHAGNLFELLKERWVELSCHAPNQGGHVVRPPIATRQEKIGVKNVSPRIDVYEKIRGAKTLDHTQANTIEPFMREPVEDAAGLAEPIQWVIKDMLAAGCVYILAGRAKVTRKTLTCMHLGRCVSSGIPFFSRETYTRQVVYTMLEDGQKRARRRAAMMGFRDPTWQRGDFMVEYEIEDYEATLRQMQTGELKNIVWVIDSLPEIVAHMGLDENKAGEMTKLIRGYRKLVQLANSTIIFIHHLNKGGEKMRGSTAFEGSGDGWAEAQPMKNGTPGVQITWTLRDGPSQRFILDLDRDERGQLMFREVDVEAETEARDASYDREVLAFMGTVPFEEGRSVDDIIAGVNTRRGGAKGLGRDAVSKAVKRLRDEGALFKGKLNRTYRDRTWWELRDGQEVKN